MNVTRLLTDCCWVKSNAASSAPVWMWLGCWRIVVESSLMQRLLRLYECDSVADRLLLTVESALHTTQIGLNPSEHHKLTTSRHQGVEYSLLRGDPHKVFCQRLPADLPMTDSTAYIQYVHVHGVLNTWCIRLLGLRTCSATMTQAFKELFITLECFQLFLSIFHGVGPHRWHAMSHRCCGFLRVRGTWCRWRSRTCSTNGNSSSGTFPLWKTVQTAGPRTCVWSSRRSSCSYPLLRITGTVLTGALTSVTWWVTGTLSWRHTRPSTRGRGSGCRSLWDGRPTGGFTEHHNTISNLWATKQLYINILASGPNGTNFEDIFKCTWKKSVILWHKFHWSCLWQSNWPCHTWFRYWLGNEKAAITWSNDVWVHSDILVSPGLNELIVRPQSIY